MILHTGIALGVTLVVLAGALAILQYREKVCFEIFVEKIEIFVC
jgi:hypothetical protein